MGGIVAVVHQLGVRADLAVVAGDELEEAQHAAFVHDAEHEGRSRIEQALLDVLAEADQTHREIVWRRLLDLPDVEINEAHREHVVGEEGELELELTPFHGHLTVMQEGVQDAYPEAAIPC